MKHDELQLEKQFRSHARGNVQIHYFMAEDTCEWQMWNALQKKDKEQNEFLTLTKQ